MKENDSRNWNEEKIWASILDPGLLIHPKFDADLFKWWKDKVGISKEEYIEMNAAQRITQDKNYDSYNMITYAKERIENLEYILKRPNIHPMQKKVAKILRDRLKARINRKKYGAVGCWETAKAIDDGDIDPENLEGNE